MFSHPTAPLLSENVNFTLFPKLTEKEINYFGRYTIAGLGIRAKKNHSLLVVVDLMPPVLFS